MEPIIRAVEAKGILTKSDLPVSDYSANPYVGCTHGCRYCYASFMKRFTNHPEPWGGFLDVKYWPEIGNPQKYAGKEVFLGSVTDPYLPQEAEYRRTRALLEQLAGSGVKLSIATKSDLVLRDLELIRTFPDARVSWSINTLDEGFKDDMDRAASIERRFAAMEEFHRAGVRTTCFISPIFPGITDVEAIIMRAREHCNLIWLENLNLRGGFKGDIMGYIGRRQPRLLSLYRDIYERVDMGYWELLDGRLREFCARLGLDYVTDDDSMRRPFEATPVVVNYFYHERIKKSAGKGAEAVPELPEVETVRRVLRAQLPGARFGRSTMLSPEAAAHPGAEDFCRALEGRAVEEVERRGKFLVFRLGGGARLVVHLRMTGRVLLCPASYPPERHTRAVMAVSGGRELRFCDQRRFGRLWLLLPGERDVYSGMENLGPEPFDPALTAEYLRSALGRRRRAVKECLMEQGVVAGIGNIYSDEILFDARIDPRRAACTLEDGDWRRLAAAIPERLEYFIEKNAITPEEYLLTGGLDYRNTPYLQVYGQAGEPCARCGETLLRVVIGGRSSVYCPRCQGTSE